MKLEDIARALKEQVANDDSEEAHSKADDLLLEAVHELGRIAGREDEAKEIIAQWVAIDPKWYA
jgi:ABC-type Fe3+-hydroxamate transport system substrate-binding protein